MPKNAAAADTQPDAGDASLVAKLPVTLGLVRIVTSVVDAGLGAVADEPLERLTRVRDADQPSERWNGDLGEHDSLPLPKQSKRTQVLLGVRMALSSMPSAGQSRTPPVAPQPPAPAIEPDDHQAQLAGLSPSRLALATARATKAAKADLPTSSARQGLAATRHLHAGGHAT
jgi:hypothetical protein